MRQAPEQFGMPGVAIGCNDQQNRRYVQAILIHHPAAFKYGTLTELSAKQC
jgi:hypothetical protein